MIYPASLEALDRKAGRLHTLEDYTRVSVKAHEHVATLTDDDLVLLAGFGGDHTAAAARARRDAANTPPAPTIRRPVITPKRAASIAPLVKALIDEDTGIIPLVVKKLVAHKDRADELEQRLSLLETKPHVKFCGVWEAHKTYEPGDAATHQGGLWVCKAVTTAQPSKDFVGWQLAVKRGTR